MLYSITPCRYCITMRLLRVNPTKRVLVNIKELAEPIDLTEKERFDRTIKKRKLNDMSSSKGTKKKKNKKKFHSSGVKKTKINSFPYAKNIPRKKYPRGTQAKIATGYFCDELESYKPWHCSMSMCGLSITGNYDFDHMCPLQYNGKDCCRNLQILCKGCHDIKTLNIDPLIKEQNLKTRKEILNLQQQVYNEMMQ